MLSLLLSFAPALVYGAITGDLVASLPGFGPPPTPWYSGYLSVPGGKHLHYIFIESPNPSVDPVTAWFNGGASRAMQLPAQNAPPTPPPPQNAPSTPTPPQNAPLTRFFRF